MLVDFPTIRRALSAIDWDTSLIGDDNEQWATFASIVKQIESQHILQWKETEPPQEKGTVDDLQSGKAC